MTPSGFGADPNAASAYFDAVVRRLEMVRDACLTEIEIAAAWVADAVTSDRLIWVTGSGHAGLLAEETFFRAGGLAAVTPLRIDGLSTETTPITLTSLREREEGYVAGHCTLRAGPGDVVVVHSASGRNAAPIEIAGLARSAGARTIAITSLEFAGATTPRNSEQLHLHDVVDLVIDSKVPAGDAIHALNGDLRVGPVSTILAATILHSVFAGASEILASRGTDPPVFRSSNVDGGDQENAALLRRYQGRVTYL